MNKEKPTQVILSTDFDAMDNKTRILTFNIALSVGILACFYFGIRDYLNGLMTSAIISVCSIIIMGVMLATNIIRRGSARIINLIFISFIGTAFLILIYTKYSGETVVFWGFVLPLVAVFATKRTQALFIIIVYNLLLTAIFFEGLYIDPPKYTFNYAVRYSTVMIVISAISYYYEILRNRSLEMLRSLNNSLEQKAAESCRKLAQTQEWLKQSEKLEAIGLLAGGIAHDFNNQLTGITAFAEMIRESAGDNDEIREYADSILAGSRRSAKMTNQLLAFARKGNMLSVPVDINKTVNDTISILNHTLDKKITVKQHPGANPSTVTGDPDQLENVLLNLALNAGDSMPEGGELSFTTETTDLDEAFSHTIPWDLEPGSYVTLSVKDTGCGMDRETMKHIFEPFFTTKKKGKGTGMGLAAAYGTIRDLKGAITVNSEPEKGTEFRIFLPVTDKKTVPREPDTQASFKHEGDGRILLVDDEQNVCLSVKKLLQSFGYSVTTRNNGREAVEYYRENWHSITLVILDVVMPVMDGKKAFLKMNKINPEIKALLSSGYSMDNDLKKILAMGAVDFLQKPFTREQLQNKISSAMGSKFADV